MYILDTNVISELRKGKKADQRVRMWAQAQPAANFYLSLVSVLELEIGALLIERRDRKRGAILRAGSMVMFYLHSPGEFWRSIPLWPSDAHRSMCQILALIGMLSSQPLPSFMA
jgi:hypothetical protein